MTIDTDYLGAFTLADDRPPPASEVEAAGELDDLVTALARRSGEVTDAVVRGASEAVLREALSGGSEEAERALGRQIEDALFAVATGGLQSAALLGALHIERLARDAGTVQLADYTPPGSDEPIPFEEAAAALRARIAVPAPEFYRLEDALRFRAFTVSAVAGIDVVRLLQAELARSLVAGETFETWAAKARSVAGVVDPLGAGPLTPWRFETIWRTNATAANLAGRWSQIRAFGDDIEVLEYITIEDTRTTEVCRSYAGIVRPSSDPIWNAITPPNHFNCRSTIRPVFSGTEEARMLVVTPDGELADIPRPQKGFEASPVSAEAMRALPPALRDRAQAYGLLARIEEGPE